MNKMRSAWLGLCLVVLTTASCGFPRLSELADGGGGSDGGPPALSLELLAGDIGGPGSEDGTGAAAHFDLPNGVAVDSTGNIYVADQSNHTIRKVTPEGVVTTLAGTAGMSGSVDGTGAAARFYEPTGIAVDSAGNVYVADKGYHTIRKVTPGGVVTTLAGIPDVNGYGSADGPGAAARFREPGGVAVDSAGNVYVADTGNDTIRKITAGVVTTLAGTAGMGGDANGTGAAARFFEPAGVAVDSAGNLYVADSFNSIIRKVTAAGVVTTLAGTSSMYGSADGTGAAASFNNPTGVAVDSAGNVYVADRDNDTIRKVTAVGVVTTLAGTAGMGGSTDGAGAAARFYNPTGVGVDSAGNVYVAAPYNFTIRKVTSAGVVTTLAGTAGMGDSVDGTGAAARFNSPTGVGVDGVGNVYVADSFNATIRKVTTAGVVTTLAGTARASGSANGTGAAARFDRPVSVAVDSAGNVYVADSYNNTIRKVTAAGVVTTLAGTVSVGGTGGSSDGTGTAARFIYPTGVTVDSAGNVYVADQGNPTVRKVTSAGVVTTLAGTTHMSGSTDGTGAAARFYSPSSVAVDSAGNVYVTDQDTIRKVTATGVVTTLAGTTYMSGSVDDTGAAARFNNPTGVAVDSAGNIYVADQGNSAIRKITPTGITTTVAGMAGTAGIILGATPRLAFPQSLAIVGDSIVVSDTNAILLLRHIIQ